MSVCDQVHQVVSKLQLRERTVYKRPLEQPKKQDDPTEFVVLPSWRKTILEWMYGLTTKCSVLSKETIAITAYYLDVSISQGLIRSQLEFKVVSVTCLFLATKVMDSSSTSVTLEDLIQLCSSQFSATDIVQMELQILTKLQWRLYPPTPNCFVHQFLRLFPNETTPQTLDKVQQISQLMIEVATCQPMICSQSLPSEVAYASLLLATEFVGTDAELSIRNRQIWFLRMSTYCALKSNHVNVLQAIKELGNLISEEEIMTTRICEILGDVSAQQDPRFHTNDKSSVWPNYQQRNKLSPRSPQLFSGLEPLDT